MFKIFRIAQVFKVVDVIKVVQTVKIVKRVKILKFVGIATMIRDLRLSILARVSNFIRLSGVSWLLTKIGWSLWSRYSRMSR